VSRYLHRMFATRLIPLFRATAAATLIAGCGGAKSAPAPAPEPAPLAVATADTAARAPAPPAKVPAVFGAYASRMVVVFPLQRYAVGDSGWLMASSATGRPRAALMDTALTIALRDRGLDGTWSLTPNTSRVAQREVMNRTDPRGLSTVGLGPSRRRNDVDLREPLASQLRAIIAMVPEARIILLPIETRVVATASGQKQATLRIALLDGRMATVLSFPDVVGAPAPDERAALQSAAMRFADLVIAP
jgi:hypothetical protein